MLLVSLCLSCSNSENADSSATPVATKPSYDEALAAQWELTPEKEQELLRKANAGDAESSFLLSQCYGLSRRWRLEAHRWLVVAAEQGSADAAGNLAMNYTIEGPDWDKHLQRAKYWAEIAKQRGAPRAADHLDQINNLIREEESAKSKPKTTQDLSRPSSK